MTRFFEEYHTTKKMSTFQAEDLIMEFYLIHNDYCPEVREILFDSLHPKFLNPTGFPPQ